jgi:hypothetical protein
MKADDSSPPDLNSPNTFRTNGDAAGHQRLPRALKPGSPGDQEKAVPLPAGQEATDLEIVAFANMSHYRINPETSALEVCPGVHPDALKAVESFETQSEISTLVHDGDTITTTTTTTEIVLRDRLAALESLAGRLRTAEHGWPPPSPANP